LQRARERVARAQDADALPHHAPHALAHRRRDLVAVPVVHRRSRLLLRADQFSNACVVRAIFNGCAPRTRAEDETFKQ